MENIVLAVHILLAIGIVVVVLLQRSEGGGLGMGGGGSGGGIGGGLMTGRGAANLLTRTTAVLATLFIITSLTLAAMSRSSREPDSILDRAPQPATTQPSAPSAPATPAAPQPPLAR